MPRVLSEQYVASENVSASSTSTGDPKTLQPTAFRAVGVWLTVEGSFAARVTFNGDAPGTGAPPGLLIPTGTPPLFYPFAFTQGVQQGPKLKFASNGAGDSTVSAIFVQ